jgi:hypothetical protein
MSVSFNIFKREAVRVDRLLCLGAVVLACLQSQGRPIEFSEPTGTNLTANVSELGTKPSRLPETERGIFKSDTFNSAIDSDSIKPLKPLRGSATLRNGGRQDQGKNWMLMTPEETMQSLIDRDAYKQSRSGASAYGLWPATSLERYHLQTSRQNSATNRLGAYDFPGRSRETNRWDNASGASTLNDPFAAYGGRRPLPGGPLSSDLNATRPYSLSDLLRSGDDMSSDAISGRKALADHMEEFKKSLDPQIPAANHRVLNPTSGNGGLGNSSDPLPGSSFSSLPEKVKSAFAPPSVRLAPTAPLAPGQTPPDQTSLTPSPNSAPSKPKSVISSAPQRRF